METNSILQADILDIIFENKNKDYGAYELRKSYNKRIKIAMGSMVAFGLFASLATVMAKTENRNTEQVFIIDSVTLQSADPLPAAVILPKPLPAKSLKHVDPQIKMIQSSTPILTDNVDVPPPTQEEQENVVIGTITTEGKSTDMVAPPIEEGTGKVEAPKVAGTEIMSEVIIVQIQAKFPGGLEAWKKFLERNLKSEIATDNGAPEGAYKVVVSFLVGKDGTISEVQALNNPGYGIAEEAIRVIKKGPKWIPAMQNDHAVIYRQKQQVTFEVQAQQ